MGLYICSYYIKKVDSVDCNPRLAFVFLRYIRKVKNVYITTENRPVDRTSNWSILCIGHLGSWQRVWRSGYSTDFSFRFLCTFSYPLSLAGGGLVSETLGDSIFLLTLGLTVAVLECKGVWVFFYQEKLVNLLNATCVQMPNDKELADGVNRKLNILQKCCAIFIFLTACLAVVITMVSSPLIFQPLPYTIWFPLDYKMSYTARWIAHFFVLISELYLLLLSFLSSIMWHVMLNC